MQTAKIRSTTTSLAITTLGTRTITSTQTQSTCAAITGCNVEDEDEATTVISGCEGAPTTTLGCREATPTPETALHARQANGGACATNVADDTIIYPVDPENIANIIDYLKVREIDPSNPNGSNWWFDSFLLRRGAHRPSSQGDAPRKAFVGGKHAVPFPGNSLPTYLGAVPR